MEGSKGSVGPAAGIPAYIIVDSQDPDRIVPFWCALLGVEVRHYRGGGQIVALEPSPSLPGAMMLVFQRVPEAKTGKNRVHVDMFVNDLEEGTARVQELGGRWIEPGTTVDHGGSHWRVMADPEGNEFCICLAPGT